EIVQSQSHLVEIDLLRGGIHTTAVSREVAVAKAGPFDYHVSIHRFDRPKDFFVYPISLQNRLPVIPIPLLPGDPDTTAVNIFEGRRNLLWVKDLKQLITYCKSNISSMKIIGYIVNANLIVILGDMDKDRATPDRPDNPLSKCRHASNDLHGSGRETRAEQEAQPGYFPGPLLACAVSGSSGHECLG